jgi:hypothetical protein
MASMYHCIWPKRGDTIWLRPAEPGEQPWIYLHLDYPKHGYLTDGRWWWEVEFDFARDSRSQVKAIRVSQRTRIGGDICGYLSDILASLLELEQLKE